MCSCSFTTLPTLWFWFLTTPLCPPSTLHFNSLTTSVVPTKLPTLRSPLVFSTWARMQCPLPATSVKSKPCRSASRAARWDFWTNSSGDPPIYLNRIATANHLRKNNILIIIVFLNKSYALALSTHRAAFSDANAYATGYRRRQL
jgi:hypothetical protein